MPTPEISYPEQADRIEAATALTGYAKKQFVTYQPQKQLIA